MKQKTLIQEVTDVTMEPQVEVTLEVKRRGRPIAEWRHGEDGKYNKQAIDPEYSTQYWRENFRKPFICPICETSLKTVGSNVLKHQRTLHCQLTKYKKEQAAIN